MRWPAYGAAALLFAAILFGGGGAEGPFSNGVIAAASGILLYWLAASHIVRSWPLPGQATGALWLLAALLGIILLQLIPLPPGMWAAMPGRSLAQTALALVPQPSAWRPLSLDPEATRRSAAALLLPAAMMLAVLGATRREGLLLVKTLVAGAGISALIGALQLILGNPEWLSVYDGPNVGAASGVFANPSHQGALLLVAILCLGVMIRIGRPHVEGRRIGLRGGFHLGWLALPFFVAMTLSTGSRATAALLLLAVPAAAVIALGRRSPLLWLGVLAAVAAIAAIVVALSPSGTALSAGQSLMFGDDVRYAFLPDVLFTLREYWPVGSGLGTFVPVFGVNENLDIAGAGFVNHAHNDLLELLLETGIVGALWLVAVAAALLWRVASVVMKRDRTRSAQVAIVLTGAFTLALLALHSLADYPLRTAALAAVAGVAIGLILAPLPDAAPVQSRASAPDGTRLPRWPLVLAGVAGVLIAAQTIRIGLAQAAVRDGNGTLGAALRPQNGAALARGAEELLAANRPDAARAMAFAALDRAPLSVRAARVVAMAARDGAAGGRAWQVASALGWRDAPTQFWAMQQALANGQWDVAAVRADAFLRTQGSTRAAYLGTIRGAAADPRFRRELIKRLMLAPPWQRNFFIYPPSAPDRQVAGMQALLHDLVPTARKPSRGEASSTIAALIKRRLYRSAVDLYAAIGGRRGTGGNLLDDGGFDRPNDDYRQNSTPFDWTFYPRAGSSASIEGGSHTLLIDADGSFTYAPTRRYVALPAGEYALHFAMRGQADSPEALGIAVSCDAGNQLLASSPTAPLRGAGFEQRRLTFTLPANCPMIVVAFQARPVGRPVQAEFDAIALKRL